MPSEAVLAFDTSGPWLAAALLHEGRLTARAEDLPRGQGERLMGFVENLLADQGLVWGDLAALGIGVGPGNFTGIRIAVAAGRGLALGLGIPAHGVSRFEAAALDRPRPLTIEVPAPRGQVYRQRFTEAGPDTPTLAVPSPGAVPGLGPEPLAAAIARIAARIAASRRAPAPRPAPLYIKPADAAPSRLAPPVLLP